MKKHEIRKIVGESYGEIADSGCCGSCGCTGSDKADSKKIGYSEDEINAHPEANLGLGCGNPTSLSEIKEGMAVLDLGSGAGFDCFLAAKKVGKSGRVIGVDMTEISEYIKNVLDGISEGVGEDFVVMEPIKLELAGLMKSKKRQVERPASKYMYSG